MKKKENITGIILAGGKSSRMGSDKSLLTYNNSTFLELVIKAMKPLVENILIVSSNLAHDKLSYKRVEDIITDSGPLAGIHAGLSHSTTDYNLILSCDIPLITTEILEELFKVNYQDYDVVQIESNNKTMPLIAIYNKHCANKFLELLENDERRLRQAVKQLQSKSVIVDTKWSAFVKNVNTKEDLKDISHAIEH